MRHFLLVVAVVLTGCLGGCSGAGMPGGSGFVSPFSSGSTSASLPLPSTVSRTVYEEALYTFLATLQYRKLGWRRDKFVRDTGDFIDGKYYGTHPAVLCYYSPEVMAWLNNGRQGIIADGAIIIKEMYPPPAARYTGKNPDSGLPMPTWTVMVRDSQGSKDGWFWSYYDSAVGLQGNEHGPEALEAQVAQAVDNDLPPFNYPNSGFGLYCVRCHASAETNFTFADSDNIAGEPGTPLTYFDDGSWKTRDKIDQGFRPPPRGKAPASRPVRANPLFAATFTQMTPPTSVQSIPGVTTSNVVAGHGNQFLTSNQCLSCHAGDTSPFGPNMIAEGQDVSPFGEWSWSMMGLAGRDPVFHAQLESEVALHGVQGQVTPQGIQDTCLRCHGVMGQRQFHLDNGASTPFTQEMAMSTEGKYGGLARDGVSCTVCHQIKPNADVPLQQIETGNFEVMPPAADGTLTINGPAENPTEYPMHNALGVNPVHNQYVTTSRLCASCHTVNLPVLDANNNVIDNRYEQATFLEWGNSNYRDGGPTPVSCQQCHMPGTFKHNALSFKLANIQDQDFPISSFVAAVSDIFVPVRANYSRHTLLGVNQFAMEMFNQFPAILGVNKYSYMSGLSNGLQSAIANAEQQATEATATVQVLNVSRNGSQLTANVKVTNLTGHRFPSGVGFRRGFIGFEVTDGSGATVWASGRTNSVGVILDGNGTPLPSEFFTVDANTGQQAFQPHHPTITNTGQVQIYEELTKTPAGLFTTSFLSRATTVKDNRLLPKGWTLHGPPGFSAEFAEATAPEANAATDPDFTDGTGSDTVAYAATLPAGAQGPFTVSATLYYQALPPYYLAQRFSNASGPATQRLYYLAQNLDTSQTNFPSWKLRIAGSSASVP